MNNENNNTPRLRFPEFTGEWVEKKLGEVATFKRGTTITAKDTIPGNVPVIAGGQTPSYFHNESNRDGETIAVSGSGAYAGFVSFWDIPVFLSDSFSVETKDELIKKYAFYYLKHQQNKLFLMQKGAGVPHVHGSDVGELLIYLPSSLAEQQKIASCLSELDALICSQGKKVDALKEKKKGMMQQLFPQPGETTPCLRFPGFTGEWEEKKLGDVAERVSVGLATSVTPYYRDKGIVMFRNLNIKPGWLDDSDILYLDETFANENPSKKVHTDDVLTVLTGYVGISCVVPHKYDGALTFTTLVTTTKKEILNSHFLCSFLNSSEGERRIATLQAGGGRNNLNVNDFVLFQVPLPPTMDEQQKIASCLSELDALIADEAKQLDALKETKKGLMQQLFPQPTK